MFVYRWAETEAMLAAFRDHDGSPYDGISVEFVNPRTGGPVYKTMTFFVQMTAARRDAAAGARERQPHLSPCSAARATASSAGSASIGTGSTRSACPAEPWCQHVNDGGEDAVFFVSSDEPTLRALGFSVRHGRAKTGDVVLLESSTR